MALLINKLFSSKKKLYSKHTDVGDRAFSFSKDQVRVVLFRECDFRGRKLLFDSKTVQKVPLASSIKEVVQSNIADISCSTKHDSYVEISDGYGYQYSRPSNDTVILGETVFGSVAMSYQGTSFKIHSFSSPPKLMCTQVFPCPKNRIRSRVSATNNVSLVPPSNSSGIIVEKSGRFEYSSASSVSTASFNEPLFGQSTDSEARNVTKGDSAAVDVPLISGDSGFCGEQSYNSTSSLTLLDARLEHVNMASFSCGSLYKRWFRSASTSLDNSSGSDGCLGVAGPQNSASADDCLMRNQHRSNKLGLAIILKLTENKEIEMESFLLKHAALIEAMVGRARASAEMAYTKPGSFASLMCDIHQEVCQYLCDLLTGSTLDTYLWHKIGSKPLRTQVKTSFLTNTLFNFSKTKSESSLMKVSGSDARDRTECLNSSCSGVEDWKWLNEGDKCDKWQCDRWQCVDHLSNNTSHFADNFIKELCELLELVEVKQNNFFISTLLTAVLTHHLGWVSTVSLPTQEDKEIISKMQSPCNPLWGQLSDLYGAVGHPTKMSRTIVCGNNKGDVIGKILNMLTYFIRCSAVQRNTLTNVDTCDLNINSLEENVSKNIPTYQQSEKADMNIYENLNNLVPKQNTNHIEQLEMKTLKIPAWNMGNENSETTSKKTNNFDMKSHSNSSIEKRSNYLKPNGLKSMKKSTSYVGNLCLQSESSSSNCVHDKFRKMDQEDKVVFVLGENEELTGLKQSLGSMVTTDCLQTFESTQNKQVEMIEKLSLPIKQDVSVCDNETRVSKLIHDKDVRPSFSINEDVHGKNDELQSLRKVFALSKIEEMKKVSQNNDNDSQSCFSNENDTLNIPSSSKINRPTELKLPAKLFNNYCDSSPESPSNCLCAEISPCSECEKLRKRSASLQPNDIDSKIVLAHSNKINIENNFDDSFVEPKRREGFDRSQSVPPSDKKRKCSKTGCKKKYAGVKFDMRQYPQIVTNYMKSKDLDISQLPFGDKSLKLNRSFSTILYDNCIKDFPACDCEHETEALTTPSNASELEFTSDLECDKYEFSKSCDEVNRTNDSKTNIDVVVEDVHENENNAIFDHEVNDIPEKNDPLSDMFYSEFPLLSIDVERLRDGESSVGYTHTLLRGINATYMSDMVLQGTTSPLTSWETVLKRDLRLTARQPLLDQPIQEAVAIVANTDTWEVQLISSHSYVVERGCAGVRICLSQLVANMLETLLHMWKLRTPTEYCLMHIEAKLREFYLHSKTMAQILLNTEFCNMDTLTSALQLEVNDIPLLMAVASTHTPQVTQKYGLSFQ